ncbi:MAG TPA: NfeD family protein [Solirubrobacterales bacterium]
MDAYVVIALLAVALLLAELLLPTGGLLALLGALGLIGAGVVALESDSSSGDWIGPALITVGVLSAVTAYVVGRKVLSAQTDNPIGTGRETLIGSEVEVRATLDPEGQVWSDGALWRARLSDEGTPARPGDRVVVEAVDGLTLVVRPAATPADPVEQGAS